MSALDVGSQHETGSGLRNLRANQSDPKPGFMKPVDNGDTCLQARRGHLLPAPCDTRNTNAHLLQACLEEQPLERDSCPVLQVDDQQEEPGSHESTENEAPVEETGTREVEDATKKAAATEIKVEPGLREIVIKFSGDKKTSREVLVLQQQIYQEECSKLQEKTEKGSKARERAVIEKGVREVDKSESPSRLNTSVYNYNSNNCKLPWKFNSPKGHNMEGGYGRRSPNFRRTPGASRPPTTRPYTTHYAGTDTGASRSAAPFWSGSGWRSFFQTGGPPGKLLHASDLGRAEGREPGPGTGPGGGSMAPGPCHGTVHLMVSNLDYNISAREWKKILAAEFQQHVQVLSTYIQTQVDNTNVAYIQVSSTDEARYAISQFHRKKIGYKRIHVCLINNDTNSTAANSRLEVVGLLKEVTGNNLPLFKFIEMFEKRYHRGISVSELYRMRDVIEIEEEGGTGRTVALLAPSSTKAASSDNSDQETEELEHPICKRHCSEGSAGYVAALDSACLPNAILQLRSFAAQVHTLLQSHDGSMPLMSFQSCYEAEFHSLPVSIDGGVPLEHLISCIPGVKVSITRSGVKKIQWAENKPVSNQDTGRCSGGGGPLMTQQLSQFSREIVDLLKHAPQCRMFFSKFIPSYHHHYGRQCRVADYGYTKLMELFEAIPHVVQVIGSGSRRFVTLSHRTQVKRFTSDLIKVLKSQVGKKISIMDLPIIYHKVIGKAFDITDYGVCYIEDILCEMPESTVLVQGVGRKMAILIPVRVQTPAEVERTKAFSVEVIDLLRHSPHCRMPFNKFIPAYHHHFGKQCRVADYGFTKLIELFESIPNTLKMEDEDDDKMLCLTQEELIRVLEDQVVGLLRSCADAELPVPELLNTFMRFHGHSIRLQDFGVSSVSELIQLIPNTATIETSRGRSIIKLVDHSEEQKLTNRVLIVLMEKSDSRMMVDDLCALFYKRYNSELLTDTLFTLQGHLDFTQYPDNQGSMVKLNTLQMFARDARTILLISSGRLSMQQFEGAFAMHFGAWLVPPAYGYPSVYALLQAIPHVITIRGKGYRRLLLLTPEFQESDESKVTPSVNQGGSCPIWSPGRTSSTRVSPEPDTELPNETQSEPHSEPSNTSTTEAHFAPCVQPCVDPQCIIPTTSTSVTANSNDSGITEIHERRESKEYPVNLDATCQTWAANSTRLPIGPSMDAHQSEPHPQPLNKPAPAPYHAPCGQPCMDTRCPIHGASTCVTSPSNDSGITECHDFSPEETLSPPANDSNEFDVKITKPKDSKAQRQLFFDPGNIPVPDTFSNYDQHLEQPKTPLSDVMQLAARSLPQGIRPATYGGPATYGIPGPTFRFSDRGFVSVSPGQQCQYISVEEPYQGYVPYGQYPTGDYCVQNLDCTGIKTGKYGIECPRYQRHLSSTPTGGPQLMPLTPGAPPTPPPYPVFPVGVQGGVMPITCESLEASTALCPEMRNTEGAPLEQASAKLKDICSSAPPPTLRPQSCSPLTDDNNNELTYLDAEAERKTFTINTGLGLVKTTADNYVDPRALNMTPEQRFGDTRTSGDGVSKDGEFNGRHLSPRKRRLAARFDGPPTPINLSMVDLGEYQQV